MGSVRRLALRKNLGEEHCSTATASIFSAIGQLQTAYGSLYAMEFLRSQTITLMCEVDKSFVTGYIETVTLCEDANTTFPDPVFSWEKRNNTQKILPNTSRTHRDSNWVAYIWKYTQEIIKFVM